jgi:hypothetical protein
MLAEIILKAAGMGKQERQPYRRRPSSAGPERCIRQMVFHANKTPVDKEMADRFVMVLDDSAWHEELTGDWIQKTAYKLHSQQMQVEIDGIGSGNIDGISTDIVGTDYLFEHKALSHCSFERYWKGTWPLDYFSQCILYVKGIQKVNPEIKKAILLIKNKNTSQYIDFLIHYDNAKDTATIESVTHSNGESRYAENGKPLLIIENIVSDAIKKFEEVDRHVANSTLPKRPFELSTKFPCGYCSWETTCWSDYEKEYQKLETDAILDEEIAQLAKYYMETNCHIKEMKAEHDSLKAKIKAILKTQHVREGRAGEYTITNVLQTRTKINKEMIPPDILKAATEKYQIEMLSIRKPKNNNG